MSKIYYKNEQWLVTGWGLECEAHGYYIPGKELKDIDYNSDLPEWIIHVGRKSWADLRLFVAAFREAQDVHGEHFTNEQITRAERQTALENQKARRWGIRFDEWMINTGRIHSRHFHVMTGSDMAGFAKYDSGMGYDR